MVICARQISGSFAHRHRLQSGSWEEGTRGLGPLAGFTICLLPLFIFMTPEGRSGRNGSDRLDTSHGIGRFDT